MLDIEYVKVIKDNCPFCVEDDPCISETCDF